MANPTTPVTPPRRRPRLGGLYEIADVRDNVGRIAVGATPVFVPEPCNMTFNEVGLCYEAPGDPKTFDGVGATGQPVVEPYGLGYGVKCFIGPDSQEDFLRRARLGLEGIEERAAEAALYSWLEGAAPVPLGSLALAIAAADHEADENYIGQPVIHMSRGTAVIAASQDLIFGDGAGALWTINGTPVVASASYVNNDAVWVSGDVTVLRSATVETPAVELEKNQQYALVERVLAIMVDCGYRAKYTVTPTP